MGVPDDDGHVEELLGSYVLGRLGAAEECIVEQHLRWCVSCCVKYQYVGAVHGYLAMLTGDDVRELLSEVEQERIADGVHAVAAPTAMSVAAPTAMSVADPMRSRRRRGYRRAILAAAVVVLAVGAGVGTWLRGSAATEPPAVDLVATATDSGTGVSATVVLTPRNREIAMRVTMDGLRPGVFHRLLLVDRAGQPVEVAAWSSSARSQTLGVNVARDIDDVAIVAIATSDGTVVLSVPLGHDDVSPPPLLPAG